MEVNLPADLTQQLQTEVAAGRHPSASTLIEQALRRFLTEQQRGSVVRAQVEPVLYFEW